MVRFILLLACLTSALHAEELKDFRPRVRDALKHGETRIVIPAGTYRLGPESGGELWALRGLNERGPGNPAYMNPTDVDDLGLTGHLSEREREILSRFYMQEQTQQQICLEMGLTHTQYRLLKWRSKAHFEELSRKQICSRHLRSLCANNPH